jgi:predicted NAD/FAD-dependent oxidoreductase
MGDPSARRSPQLHFAVIGAGIAGLACARSLAAGGMRATVFEMRPGVGGRACSVQADGGLYDVGAQFFTVQSAVFAEELRRWVEADLVRTWEGPLVEMNHGREHAVQDGGLRFVPVPSMQSIPEFLARGLDIVCNAPIGRVVRMSDMWCLFDGNERQLGISGFDGVVLAIPSVHALPLLQAHAEFAARLVGVSWDSCWTARLALSRPSGVEFDGAFIHDDPILSWAARASSLPGRRSSGAVAERWVLQARSTWSNNFANLAPDDAARWMQRAFAARLARPLAQKSCVAQYWRTATPDGALAEHFLWDEGSVIGVAGDWCGGARIESAFVSGVELARAILG